MYDQVEETRVIRLAADEASSIIAVLWESFYDYPVMRYVLRDSGLRYSEHLHKMITLFVSARLLLNDVILGIRSQDELVAVVTTSDPSIPPHPDFAALREHTWEVLGPEALARYQQFVDAWTSMEWSVPQLHVNMIGVCRAHQRRGLARTLLYEVHRMAQESPSATGISLTTEDERNVSFYQRQGYEIIGHRQVGSDLQAWSFFRPKDAPGQL